MDVVVDNTQKLKLTVQNKITLGELTAVPPSIAYHKGNLWVAWVGLGEKQLNIVRLDPKRGGGYIENASTKRTLNSESDGPPSLVSDGTRLYMAFIGVGSHQVCIVSSTEGNNFTPQSKNVLNSESALGPHLAVLKGQLYIGFSGVNGRDFSIIGPADVDANGKANFNIQDKKTLPGSAFSYCMGMCAYDQHLVLAGINSSNNIALYRWQKGQNLPTNPYAILPVKSSVLQCAAIQSGSSTNLWITSFFNTSKPSYITEGFGEVVGEFYWYLYRVVDNSQQSADIQGACSLFGDSPENYALVAVSDDGGVVNVAWQGTDAPSHVNVGTIPQI